MDDISGKGMKAMIIFADPEDKLMMGVKCTLYLSVLMMLFSCRNPHHEGKQNLMHIPVAFITSQNQWLSFSNDPHASGPVVYVDSTCLFNFVSLNHKMDIKLGFHDHAYLTAGKDSLLFFDEDFDQALVLNLIDRGGNYFSLAASEGFFVAYHEGKLSLSPGESEASLFYAVYDPETWQKDYVFCSEDIEDICQNLKDNEKLMGQIAQKAREQGVETSDMVLLDALWIRKKNPCFNFYNQRLIHHFERLKQNDASMKALKEKANKRNIGVNTMAWEDAKWLYRNETGQH